MTRRIRNLYKPGNAEPFVLSRSKIELFIQCPRCFYLDRRLGVGRPSMPAFTLNSAVDQLLKTEFDVFRKKKEPHPLMIEANLAAIPFEHEKLDEWRENFKGVRVLHEPTNLLITGAIDDLWVTKSDELIVVDYKATSKDEAPNLDGVWQQAYKRQMEIYQWLLRHSGFTVSNTGYFVYANGKKHLDGFHASLMFDVHLIPYTGSDAWIEKSLHSIVQTLEGKLPHAAKACEYCSYRKSAQDVEMGYDAVYDIS